jgi:pSer/pThr/pTyr-binding forkhead associated (FHA) protein
MGILSDFEERIGGALEGMFAGVFRSPVQPVEIARSLAKAMDDGRTLGVGKVYAPLGFTVALSPEDDENFGSFRTTLAGELSTFLADHARENGYHLAGPPHISFVVHDDLRLGRFRVSAELAAPEYVEPPLPPVTPATVQQPQPAAADVPRTMPSPAALPTVSVGATGRDVVLQGSSVVVGRLATSGIRLSDANVSREHAAFVREADGWAIEDLASTNGTLLNGSPVSRARLHDGDVVEIGVTRLTYHEPTGVMRA